MPALRPSAFALLLTLLGLSVASVACTTTTEQAAPAADNTPAAAEPEPTGGDGTTGPAKPGSCETSITNANARSPKPARGRIDKACTAKEIGMMTNPALTVADLRAQLSPECGKCLLSDPTDAIWGAAIVTGPDSAAPNLAACLMAKGESKKCAEGVARYDFCTTDACAACKGTKAIEACTDEVSSESGQCTARLKAEQVECSADFEESLAFCNSMAALSFMCGGKVDPAACTSLTQLGADVVGVAGTAVPVFTGGTIAAGTYVLTKLEGFGQLGAFAVGRTGRTTLAVTSSTFDELTLDTTTNEVESSRSAFTVSGNALTLVQSCPSSQSMQQSYTATASTLVLGTGFAGGAANGILATYTKQ